MSSQATTRKTEKTTETAEGEGDTHTGAKEVIVVAVIGGIALFLIVLIIIYGVWRYYHPIQGY